MSVQDVIDDLRINPSTYSINQLIGFVNEQSTTLTETTR